MNPPIQLRFTRRASREVADCLKFVGSFPRGKPIDRRRDFDRGFEAIRMHPERNPVEVRRRTGVELRRFRVRQFTVIYSWSEPSDGCPGGEVSIRAVRHWRAKNVFTGVREVDDPWAIASYRTV
jgi:hypothetical protein